MYNLFEQSLFKVYALDRNIPKYLLKLGIGIIFLSGHCPLVQAQVPSVNEFYNNIVSRQQAVADICSMGMQWNSGTGGSFYSYLNQRIHDAWQRGDGVMVNRYRAEGLVAKRYCTGVGVF